MFGKKYYIIFSISIILIIIGFCVINETNTRALSPLGNAGNNYEIVSNEFGEDFQKFIKDNCEVKIYTNNPQGPILKIWNMEFQIQKDNIFVKTINNVGLWINNSFNKIQKNKDNKKEIEVKNSDLDNTVEAFIKSREEKSDENNTSQNGETNGE